MVAWFKHDIPAWMDGTESLSDGAYRAYHVICQLIYLSEGPIALNEQGIAGRCNQHILTFRANLKKLVEAGKLQIQDGRISNLRAETELQSVRDQRETSAKGGRGSAGIRKKPRANLGQTQGGSGGGRGEVDPRSGRGPVEVRSRSVRGPTDNHLINNEPDASSLFDTQHHKTRLEKTREEDGASAPLALVPSQQKPDLERDYFRRVREVIGDRQGGSVAARLLKAKAGKLNLARSAIEQASEKQKPLEYLFAIINKTDEAASQRGMDPRL